MCVTTSTCSNTFSSWAIDTNTIFYNPTNNSINYRNGYEYRDFEGYTDASGDKYRFSDAIIVIPDNYTEFEKIALTGLYSSTGWGNPGKIYTDAHLTNTSNITAEVDINNVVAGDTFFKVGRSSGQTSGEIINTCTDIHSNTSSQLPSGWTLNCQIKSEIYTKNGDWGAPVVIFNSFIYNNTSILGITWGNNPSQQVSYHSSIGAIRDELTNSSETFNVVCPLLQVCN